MHGCAVRIETIARRERLIELVDDWRDLAAAAGEPNIFHEPMAVLPALDFPEAADLFWIVGWGPGPSGRRQLIGMLPLAPWRRNHAAALPKGLECWDYPLKAFGEPLIRAGSEREFWSAVLELLDGYRGASFLRLTQLRADSASTQALSGIGKVLGRPVHVTRQKQRAMLRGPVSLDDYMQRLPSRTRADKRRRRRHLAALGTVATSRLAANEDPAPWIEELIALETGGWKGRRGIAAGSDPHQAAFTRHLLHESHSQGRLDLRRLQVDGKTISMISHIETGRTAVSFKIAYDEAFAQYSPGVLLQIDYLEDGLRLDWVDSCATPGHPMYERLWRDRLAMVSLMVPFGRPAARFACASELAARNVGSRMRTRISDIAHRLRTVSSSGTEA